MWLNQGRFLMNGDCGYILKPRFLRERNVSFDPNLQTHPSGRNIKFSFSVIGAVSLPKPEKQSKGEIVDPYVIVEIVGVPADCAKFCTETISASSILCFFCFFATFLFSYLVLVTAPPLPFMFLLFVFFVPLSFSSPFLSLFSLSFFRKDNNGFNPVWNAKFDFEIRCPDVAMLRVIVMDKVHFLLVDHLVMSDSFVVVHFSSPRFEDSSSIFLLCVIGLWS